MRKKGRAAITMLLLLCFGFVAEALAQKTTSKIQLPTTDSKQIGNDKADELITNRLIRAQSGSLSALSVNSSYSYNGGSIKNPLAGVRPNIVAAGNTALISGLNGSINANYRLTKVDRLGLGVGVQMLAPFQSSIETNDVRTRSEFDENRQKLEVADPYISYTRLAKLYGVQTVFSSGLTKYSTGNLTDIGYDFNMSFSLNTMYDFGGSPISVGLLAVYDRNFFDNNDRALASFQNETIFGFLPQAEYVINDTFNLRTIIRSHWYQNNRFLPSHQYTRRPITQSIGLGISINRDFFLYPNVQFAYDQLRASNTNVGLTANINMF